MTPEFITGFFFDAIKTAISLSAPILLAGLAVGLLRAGFFTSGAESAASVVSLTLEPLFFLAAAIVAHRGALTGVGGRLLAPSCLLLAAVEATDAVFDLSAGRVAVQWGLWFSAAGISFLAAVAVGWIVLRVA